MDVEGTFFHLRDYGAFVTNNGTEIGARWCVNNKNVFLFRPTKYICGD